MTIEMGIWLAEPIYIPCNKFFLKKKQQQQNQIISFGQ